MFDMLAQLAVCNTADHDQTLAGHWRGGFNLQKVKLFKAPAYHLPPALIKPAYIPGREHEHD